MTPANERWFAENAATLGLARDVGDPALVEVHAAFDELLFLPDHDAVNVALSGVVANYATGDAVWPLLVGPPGCGKSEIVSSITSAPGVWSLSSLTPQTLLSGFERKEGSGPASLLLKIGSFGILAFKDLTTVLTMHREARAAIIGQLREVADGRCEKSFGNGLHVEWKGKLGLVAGVTPVIDEQHAFLAVMGERFLLFRMPEVARRDISRRSLSRRGHEPELRDRIQAAVGDFLEQHRECGRLDLPDEFTEPLITLADIVTRARSGVARDGYSRDLLYLPEPEAPTRLAKQLAQLAAAALRIGVGPAETWRLVCKVGWDSVPAVRHAVIKQLAQADEPLVMAEIEQATGLPQKTTQRVVEDLVALKLAAREKDAGKWRVSQSEIASGYWGGEVHSTPDATGQRSLARDVGGSAQKRLARDVVDSTGSAVHPDPTPEQVAEVVA
ncbi:MAG TPA: hypothetical protein VLJ76_00345, partial [Gaiellaceae bacterium]|nr:hypothetical protein [Gaiellaceae bacterium]